MRLPQLPWLLLLIPAVALGSRVEGTLLDVTQRPLAGLTLEVVRANDGKVATSHQADPKGRFAVELPPGRYLLRVPHPEHCPGDTDAVAVEVKEEEDIADTHVVLRRCVKVTGRAFGLDGTPLASGKVTLRWRGLAEPPRTTTTDAAGRFIFERAPQGQVEVSLQDATGGDLVSQTRLGAPRQLEVRAQRVSRFLVRGFDGAPLPGAVVLLVPEPRDGQTLEARTNDRGLVGLPVHALGRYRLLARWEQEDRYRYVWKDVELRPDDEGTPLELSFAERPSSATLAGRVRRRDGLPAANARVTAVQAFPSVPLDDDFLRDTAYPLESATTRTDAEGRFTLKDLRAGEYMLHVEHPEGTRESLTRTNGPVAEVLLRPGCAKHVSGRVVDARGSPITRFQVGSERVSNSEGRFTSPRACGLLIEASGFLPRKVSLPDTPRTNLTLPDIVLQSGRILSGRLLLPDGTPAAHHSLTVTWAEAPWPPDSLSTDTAGRFSVGPVPPDAEVVLEDISRDFVWRFRIPPGTKGERTLRLPHRGSRLEVRGLSATGLPLEGIHVTAESAEGTFSESATDSDRVLLRVPPGTYAVRVTATMPRKGKRAGIPHRFAQLKVQVPAEGLATRVARATGGSGALRVLLSRPSHYDAVYVLPGVQPWPGDAGALRSLRGLLEADVPVDEYAYADGSKRIVIVSTTAQSDYSELAPGKYTVFATHSYDGAVGRSRVFREVIEVDGKQRQLVQVRFEVEGLRELPWQSPLKDSHPE
ncbi:carboxypeptidase regulatory-like domain-containing protein [Pyxidicoccus sp. 3LG]